MSWNSPQLDFVWKCMITQISKMQNLMIPSLLPFDCKAVKNVITDMFTNLVWIQESGKWFYTQSVYHSTLTWCNHIKVNRYPVSEYCWPTAAITVWRWTEYHTEWWETTTLKTNINSFTPQKFVTITYCKKEDGNSSSNSQQLTQITTEQQEWVVTWKKKVQHLMIMMQKVND